MKTYGFDFTCQDLLDYKQSLVPKDGDELSDDFLNQVSGGSGACACVGVGASTGCFCAGAGGGHADTVCGNHDSCFCIIGGGGKGK